MQTAYLDNSFPKRRAKIAVIRAVTSATIIWLSEINVMVMFLCIYIITILVIFIFSFIPTSIYTTYKIYFTIDIIST